jgi:hypothetical protein
LQDLIIKSSLVKEISEAPGEVRQQLAMGIPLKQLAIKKGTLPQGMELSSGHEPGLEKIKFSNINKQLKFKSQLQ